MPQARSSFSSSLLAPEPTFRRGQQQSQRHLAGQVTARPRARFFALSIQLVVSALLCSGCPRRYNPQKPIAIQSSDPKVQRKYDNARTLFSENELSRAQIEFTSIYRHHSDDALAPAAGLYASRIFLKQDKLPKAREILTSLSSQNRSPQFQVSIDYYLGITLVRQRKFTDGANLLRKLRSKLRGRPLSGLYASLAYAEFQLGNLSSAYTLASLLATQTNNVSDRAFGTHIMRRILDKASIEALEKITTNHAHGVKGDEKRQLVLTVYRRHNSLGQRAKAAALRSRFPEAFHSIQSSDHQTTLLLMPLTGKLGRIGRDFLRGALFAFHRSQRRFNSGSIVVRDSMQTTKGDVSALLREHNVTTIVGPFDADRCRWVGKLALERNLLHYSLSSRCRSGRCILPQNRARINALVAAGVKKGQTVAFLAPDTPYGRSSVTTAGSAVRSRSARLGPTAYYPSDTKNFRPIVKRLAAASVFDAIVVVDHARHIRLIAPALAAEGLWSGTPLHKTKTSRRKPSVNHRIQLLLTADGLTPRALAGTQRYLQRAIIAPGYFATASHLVETSFQRESGHLPSLLEALAIDLVYSIVGKADGGARTIPLTGAWTFDENGERNGIRLYRIDGKKAIPLN